MKKRLPPSFYNPVTFAGAVISSISFGLILFLMLIDALSSEHKPYMGIIAFVIFTWIFTCRFGSNSLWYYTGT